MVSNCICMKLVNIVEGNILQIFREVCSVNVLLILVPASSSHVLVRAQNKFLHFVIELSSCYLVTHSAS